MLPFVEACTEALVITLCPRYARGQTETLCNWGIQHWFIVKSTRQASRDGPGIARTKASTRSHRQDTEVWIGRGGQGGMHAAQGCAIEGEPRVEKQALVAALRDARTAPVSLY